MYIEDPVLFVAFCKCSENMWNLQILLSLYRKSKRVSTTEYKIEFKVYFSNEIQIIEFEGEYPSVLSRVSTFLFDSCCEPIWFWPFLKKRI